VKLLDVIFIFSEEIEWQELLLKELKIKLGYVKSYLN